MSTTVAKRRARQGVHELSAPESVIGRLLASLHRRAGSPPIAIESWTGETVGPTNPRATIRVKSRATALRILADPEFQLPECYVDGSLVIEGDMVELFETLLAYGGTDASLRSRLAYTASRLTEPLRRLRTRSHARHHYDLSNEFYRLWLDPSMTYTCAYFPSAEATLEQAQAAKLELVCRKLDLRPGQHVIEAGAGWGSLALYMARSHGVTVTAYNVSREQTEHAREQAHRQGLANRVTFLEDDYRNIVGRCDAFVSVGMLEHVPRSGYRSFGRIIRQVLMPGGHGLIHTIARPRPMAPPRWTRRRIFPGGYMPALSEIADVLEPSGLATIHVEDLRTHYARTLACWLERFEANAIRVEDMFDERFVRMWRLYLASAQAGFRSGWLRLYQVLFVNSADGRALP